MNVGLHGAHGGGMDLFPHCHGIGPDFTSIKIEDDGLVWTPEATDAGHKVSANYITESLTMTAKDEDVDEELLIRPFTQPIREDLRAFGVDNMPLKHAKKISIQVSEAEKIIAFIRIRLTLMMQNNGKKIAKSWIKAICRKKQSIFPYQNKNRVKTTGQLLEIPAWWPSIKLCKYTEPDHVGRLERINLLVHLLRLRPSVNELYKWNKGAINPHPVHVEHGWTAFLKAHAPPDMLDGIDCAPEERSPRRMQYLEDIYKIAAMEEAFQQERETGGCTSFDWVLRPDELAILVGGPGNKKRARRFWGDDSDTSSHSSSGSSKKCKKKIANAQSFRPKTERRKAVQGKINQGSFSAFQPPNLPENQNPVSPVNKWVGTLHPPGKPIANTFQTFRNSPEYMIDPATTILLPTTAPNCVDFTTMAPPLGPYPNQSSYLVMPGRRSASSVDEMDFYHCQPMPFNPGLNTPEEIATIPLHDTEITGGQTGWNHSYYDCKPLPTAAPPTPPLVNPHCNVNQIPESQFICGADGPARYRSYCPQNGNGASQAFHNSPQRPFQESAALPSAVERGFTSHGSGVGGGAAT